MLLEAYYRPALLAIFVCLSLAPIRAMAETGAHIYSPTELSALAAAHGKSELRNLPLGDQHYVLDGPRKGYIYLCHTPREEEGGAGNDGPWIHGETWDPSEKVFVHGDEDWPEAQFAMSLSATSRDFVGNGLPISHGTGVFPISSNDPAFRYDRNPNSISTQNYSESVSLTPTYSDPPYCMGMEVGVMISGVPLLNGFDAGLRDAAAHELQDKCNGHPQQHGIYHYHNLSACLKNANVTSVLGYALDGFPITGGEVTAGQYLMTNDLDVCHGITSGIMLDGKMVVSYHYVMTPDFPYSVSCFRGKPSRIGPSSSGQQQQKPQGQQERRRNGPPPEAVQACTGLSEGADCGFASPRGNSINGVCRTVPEGMTACVPMGR